jgi:hypothetical protein
MFTNRIARGLLIAAVTLLAVNISPGLAERLTPQPLPSPDMEPVLIPIGILWDQLNPTSIWTPSQDFEASFDSYDTFAADDWHNGQTWLIQKITTPGYCENSATATNLSVASSIQWYIYPNAAVESPGVPGDTNEFWFLTLPPSDPQFTLTGVFPACNITLNLTTPIRVPPGTWWLMVYVTLNFNPNGQWGWASTGNAIWGKEGVVINPGGGFGWGTDWTTNPNGGDYSFSLEGFLPTYLPLIKKP